MLLALAGCGKIEAANRVALVNQARSLAGEWALVDSQSGRGQLTSTYAHEMESGVRDQLTAISETIADPRSAEAIEVRHLLDLPDKAPVAIIRRHRDRLAQIAKTLEAA